jgi:iron complex outermembrane recepter protein
MRYLFFFLFTLPLIAGSQQITGTVTDLNGMPLANATIAAKKDSTVLKYALSGPSGAFKLLALPQATLRLQVSYRGYATKDTTVTLTGTDTAAVISLRLVPLDQTLAEVKVTGAKPLIEVQADKTVFNVSQSIVGTGGNALEVLQKSPGVLVDKDDNISLNAKTGVRIYIDGRPSPLSVQDVAAMLRLLPAADVEAVEIISNPPARYEAAGNGGIINIRLKKNKLYGTNGSANIGWSVGIFPKYNGGLSLNHRNKKWNLFGNYSLQQSSYEGYLNLFRLQNDTFFSQQSVTRSESKAHNVKLGADWTPGKWQTLGILVNANFSTTTSNTDSRTPIAAQHSKDLAQTLEAFSNAERRRTNISTNINYRFADTTGHVLSADADYGYYNMNGRAFTPNYYRDNGGAVLYQTTFGSYTPATIRFYSLQASWEQPWHGGKLNIGWRSTATRTNNSFSFFDYIDNIPVPNGDRSNQFAYQESIHALYGQYSKQKGKWSYQLGLRLEGTSSLGELKAENSIADKRVQRSYTNLFPTGGVTYQLHTNHQIGISMGRRVDRPSYQDLNPFENRLDELTYQKGNPFLRPQFTNNIELKHTYKYKLSSSLSFSDVHDFFAAITDTTEGRRNFITQRNLASQRIWSFNTALPFTPAKWWNVYASAGIAHSRYRAVFGPGKEIRINATVVNLYQQHAFTFSKKWTGELSFFYLSPYVWAGTYQCRSIWSLDAGLQRKMLHDRGTLKLSVTDIFRRMPWQGTSILGQLRINGAGGWESRLLRLQATYRFGNKEVKAARQRGTGLDDLNRRVQ